MKVLHIFISSVWGHKFYSMSLEEIEELEKQFEAIMRSQDNLDRKDWKISPTTHNDFVLPNIIIKNSKLTHKESKLYKIQETNEIIKEKNLANRRNRLKQKAR